MIKFRSLLLILALSMPLVATAKNYPPRWVEMELEEVEDATAYELQFKSKQSGKELNFKTEKPQWRAKVRPGQYDMRLRSYDSRGVPGPWSDFFPMTIAFPGPKMLTPQPGAKIASGEEAEEDVEFQWEKIEGVSHYRIELTDGEKTWTEVTENNEIEFKLPVAKSYTWNVFAMQGKDDKGEGSDEPNQFNLLGEKLDKPEIQEPIDIYVTDISWKAPEFAENYMYMLSRKNKKGRWKRISRGKALADLKIPIPEDIPGGDFRLQVRAQAENRVPSDISSMEFEIYAGSRDPASVETARLKDSIEKPTDWYFIASYLITSITYEGLDKQGGSTVAYSALGGTGRLGVGYFRPNKAWGGMGILDLSGYNLDGENRTFASIEAHAAWRRYFGSNQLRISGGLFTKESLEATNSIVGDPTSEYKYEKISYFGPHIGFDFWKPVSPKLGWQANARLYMSAGGSAPNGRDINFVPSYQLGFMGSYKLSKNVMGFAGYAYRLDSVSYQSTSCEGSCSDNFAAEGDNQEVDVSGHYLNLLLEWGF